MRLIVDARTTGEDGFRVFEQVVEEAARSRFPCAGILLLGEDQAEWAKRLRNSPQVAVIVHHITFKTVAQN